MDWDKHGRDLNNSPNKKRRVAVPVTPQLNKLIELFRDTYPQNTFSDAAVLKTFIEAGAKVWYNQTNQVKQQTTIQTEENNNELQETQT